MVEKLGAAGGVCVTASHNPIGWNALKFLDKRGRFLSAEEGAVVNKLFQDENFELVSTMHLGSVTTNEEATDIHIREVLNHPLVNARWHPKTTIPGGYRWYQFSGKPCTTESSS